MDGLICLCMATLGRKKNIVPVSNATGTIQVNLKKSEISPQSFCSMKVKVLIVQSCPTLCDPMDCSLPDSSVHGILQARILEWVAMPSSRG